MVEAAAVVDLSEVTRLNVMAERTLQQVQAGKWQAPVVAIPLSGVLGKVRPFIVERDRIATALKGLPDRWGCSLDCEIATDHCGQWTLTISCYWISEASGKKCSSRTLLRPMRWDWLQVDRLKQWAEAERERRKVRPAQQPADVKRNRAEIKARQCEEQIAKLERQLTTVRPWENCLQHRLRRPAPVWRWERYSHVADTSERERWSRWCSEKYGRRKIAKVAGKYLKAADTISAERRPRWSPRHRSQIDWQQLYADLREIGCPVPKDAMFGRVGHLKGGPSERTYLKQLWHYCGLSNKSWGRFRAYVDDVEVTSKEPTAAELAAEHIEVLRKVAVAMREKAAILSEIATLRELVQSYREQANGRQADDAAEPEAEQTSGR